LHDRVGLEAFEAEITAQRASEPLPAGALDYDHYCALHHHLFQDVFVWAGKIRTVRIAKAGSAFCYPDHIDREMRALFDALARDDCLRGLDGSSFAVRSAHCLAELNAIHPFREGNGRTQLTFLVLLAEHSGHPLAMDRLVPAEMLDAMVTSFAGDETPLAALIEGLIAG
jgi:cell filamentation protein